jgi:nitric oxide reductase activation protein
MRKIAILVWLLLPIAALAYHLGPGQQKLVLDDAAKAIKLAEQYSAGQQWAKAVTTYDLALSMMPANDVSATRRVRLEKAKAQMLAAQLPAASSDLKSLVDEMVDEDSSTDNALLAEARSSLANSQYYRTWLMRLEGLPKEVWEPEIESARQTYKLLAEAATDQDSKTRFKEDLESTIRLARMDLSDLQGLPLPSQ